MNKRSIVIGASLLVASIGLGAFSYYLFSGEPKEEEQAPPKDKPKKAKETASPIKSKQASDQASKGLRVVEANPQPLADEFPLQLGSKGKRVERLQVWLLRNYGYTGKITKVFDEKTLVLVQKYLKTKTIDEKRYQQLEMGKPIYT